MSQLPETSITPVYEIGDKITMAGWLPTHGFIIDKAVFVGEGLKYMVGTMYNGKPSGQFMTQTVNAGGVNINKPA